MNNRRRKATTEAPPRDDRLRPLEPEQILAEEVPGSPPIRPAAATALSLSPTLLDGISDGYLRLSRHGMVETCNIAAARMLHVPRAWLPGKPLIVYIDGPQHMRFWEVLLLARQGRPQPPVEFTLAPRQQRPFRALIRIHPEPAGPDGEIQQLHWLLMNCEKQELHKHEADRLRAQLRAASTALAQAQEIERRRLAQGLHDHIGQNLAITRMLLGTLKTSEQQSPLLQRSLALLDDTIRVTRSLTFELSPPILTELGLVPAIQWLCERMRHESTLNVQLQNRLGEEFRPKPEIEVLLFSAVRELLHNVVKHAGASNVIVSLAADRNRVAVSVKDNGVGFNSALLDERDEDIMPFGLRNLRDRFLHIAGMLQVVSSPGAGTHITAVAPRVGPI